MESEYPIQTLVCESPGISFKRLSCVVLSAMCAKWAPLFSHFADAWNQVSDLLKNFVQTPTRGPLSWNIFGSKKLNIIFRQKRIQIRNQPRKLKTIFFLYWKVFRKIRNKATDHQRLNKQITIMFWRSIKKISCNRNRKFFAFIFIKSIL